MVAGHPSSLVPEEEEDITKRDLPPAQPRHSAPRWLPPVENGSKICPMFVCALCSHDHTDISYPCSVC